MGDKKPTYSKQVIEIADFIYANSDKKMSYILSYFVGKCRKNSRTIERYIKQAKEYNKQRLQADEKVKDKQRQAEIKEAVKLAVLTRSEALEILSDMAREKSNKGNDRINSIQLIAKIDYWESEKEENRSIDENAVAVIKLPDGIEIEI